MHRLTLAPSDTPPCERIAAESNAYYTLRALTTYSGIGVRGHCGRI